MISEWHDGWWRLNRQRARTQYWQSDFWLSSLSASTWSNFSSFPYWVLLLNCCDLFSLSFYGVLEPWKIDAPLIDLSYLGRQKSDPIARTKEISRRLDGFFDYSLAILSKRRTRRKLLPFEPSIACWLFKIIWMLWMKSLLAVRSDKNVFSYLMKTKLRNFDTCYGVAIRTFKRWLTSLKYVPILF